MNLQDAKTLSNELLSEYNLTEKGWSFLYNTRRRSLGLCNYMKRTIELSHQFTSSNDRATVEDTIRHEIAHALVGSGHGHGAVWKRMAVKVGANPRSTKSDIVQTKGKYTLIYEGEAVEELYRRPKWANRVHNVSLTGRPETLGKMKLIKNY